jgi:hypothetical protein
MIKKRQVKLNSSIFTKGENYKKTFIPALIRKTPRELLKETLYDGNHFEIHNPKSEILYKRYLECLIKRGS